MENGRDEMATSSSAKSSCGKRKYVVISLESIIVILERLKAGAMQQELADEYGIGRATVGDIKKERGQDKIVRINDGKHGYKEERVQGNALGRRR